MGWGGDVLASELSLWTLFPVDVDVSGGGPAALHVGVVVLPSALGGVGRLSGLCLVLVR
jgi:hypothetical protein